MPPERTSRPRQEPVSCQFCRTKKLKCNRDQPCQNCLARGIECERKGRLPANHSLHASDPAGNADILARLQRLEDLVLASNSGNDPSLSGESQARAPSIAPSQVSEKEKAHKADAEWLESIGLREQSLASLSLVVCSRSKLISSFSSPDYPVVSSSVLVRFSKRCQIVQR